MALQPLLRDHAQRLAERGKHRRAGHRGIDRRQHLNHVSAAGHVEGIVISRCRDGGWVGVTVSSPNYLQAFDTLARRANVHVSPGFGAWAIELASEGIPRLGTRFPKDAYYARLQVSHLAPAPGRPICFQNAAPGGRQTSTRVSMPDDVAKDGWLTTTV